MHSLESPLCGGSNSATLFIRQCPNTDMELNDLGITICLRKSKVSVGRISVCNVTVMYPVCHAPIPMAL